MTTIARVFRLSPMLCLLQILGFGHVVLAASDSDKTVTRTGEVPTAATAPAEAAAPQDAVSQQQVDELKRRVEILAAEIEQLRSGEAAVVELTDQERRALGVAPSAATTYRRKTEGVSLAGYGEMLLEKFADENEAGAAGAPATRLDFLRAILYAGYRFNDKFLFNSELEYEHGGEEVSVEFAYLDYLATKHLTVRAGMMLLPLGLVNEFHEPTVFIGAKRPETERRILPSTWRENGAGVLGSFGLVNFRAYVVNGLNASGFNASGIRGGRQGGAEALAEDLAFAGRLDVTPVPGIFAGVGVYRGGSDQNGMSTLDVDTTITEVHGQAQIRGFDIRGLFANASIDDAAELSLALGTRPNQAVAERMRGGYFQVGYNVLSQTPMSVSLAPFVRFEHVDTQNRVPAGFLRDLAREGNFTTFGVELKPIANIVVKADYQWITNEAGTGRNQFNVNLGYAF